MEGLIFFESYITQWLKLIQNIAECLKQQVKLFLCLALLGR